MRYPSGNIVTEIITRSEELPDISYNDFFHSRNLFIVAEHTPGQQPYMVVARQNGNVVAHLLATLRRRGSLIPPYLFTQGRIYGCGEYAPGIDREAVFKIMLNAITEALSNKLCLYIEFSNIPQKMFGYKDFRSEGYFPVHWMAVHISLHSKDPHERLTAHVAERIRKAYAAGVETGTVNDVEEFKAFYRMLRRFFSLKIRRYLPPERQMYEISKDSNCRILVTRYRQKVIGGCACAYSGSDAYLWYMASRSKSHPLLHPATATVWAAIEYAYTHGFKHIHFMDVGLPFRKNPFREFILSFGGKPVATYRWFRFTVTPLNRALGWIYRE